MIWISDAVARGVRRGLAEHVPAAVTRAVDEHLKSDAFRDQILTIAMQNPRFAFVKWIQARFLEKAVDLTPRTSFEMARTCLNDLLANEKIEFGDTRYDWSRDGAITVADEEISYWEAA